MLCKGIVHKYGNHVDTDVIIPARLLNVPDPKVLAQNCMVDIDPDFATRVQKGDVMVGGINFGCGSSREHAPIAIKAAGISCVIAASFARIFFRNSINIGLPVLECPEAAADAKSGDIIEVELSSGSIHNVTQDKKYTAASFPAFMQGIISAGGLVEYTKNKLEGKSNV